VALNRGRHLYSAGRPSRWALAHISSWSLKWNDAVGVILLSTKYVGHGLCTVDRGGSSGSLGRGSCFVVNDSLLALTRWGDNERWRRVDDVVLCTDAARDYTSGAAGRPTPVSTSAAPKTSSDSRTWPTPRSASDLRVSSHHLHCCIQPILTGGISHTPRNSVTSHPKTKNTVKNYYDK